MGVEEGGGGRAVRDGGYAYGWERVGDIFAGEEIGVDLVAEFEGKGQQGWGGSGGTAGWHWGLL